MKDRALYKSTSISPERSRADIDKMLKDFGVTNRAWITQNNEDVLVFEWVITVGDVQKGLTFQLHPPDIRQEKRVWNQKTSRTEKVTVRNDAIAYRLLYNYIKNKLEAVRVGMVTVENEFMAQIKLNLTDRSTTLGEELPALILNRKLENALEYHPPTSESKPRNVTYDAEATQ